MKTTTNMKAILASFLLASISISLIASGDINISPLAEKSKAIVEIVVPAMANVNVSVIDPDGNVLHRDKINKNSEYDKVFDFSQVDDGVYTFISKTELSTVTKTIALKDQALTVINKETTYAPTFKIDGDILTVYYLNQEKDDISISLIGSSDEFFKEDAGNSMSYGKMLNLKNLSRGEYFLVLNAGSNEYNYRFYR